MSKPLEPNIATNLAKQLEAINIKIAKEILSEDWSKKIHDMVVVQGELLHQLNECTNVSKYGMEDCDYDHCDCRRMKNTFSEPIQTKDSPDW